MKTAVSECLRQRPAANLPVIFGSTRRNSMQAPSLLYGFGASPISQHGRRYGHYRMGQWLLQSSALLRGRSDETSDQEILHPGSDSALSWVKANIKGFGGDPRNVTSQGVAGARMSFHHRFASGEKSFSPAISESGSLDCRRPLRARNMRMGHRKTTCERRGSPGRKNGRASKEMSGKEIEKYLRLKSARLPGSVPRRQAYGMNHVSNCFATGTVSLLISTAP